MSTTTTASPTTSTFRMILIRPGSVTHHFDFEQRYVELSNTSITSAPNGAWTLTCSPPATFQEAPPGYYMLFVVEQRPEANGIVYWAPSVSQTVLVQ